MQYKIVAADLDKTLLNNKGEVSPENWAAIEKLHQLGVYFVPSTGRSYEESPAELRESPLIRYYITSNGAVVYDKQTGKTYGWGIPQALIKKVLDKVYQYPICLFFRVNNDTYTEGSTHNARHYEEHRLNSHWVPYTLKMLKPMENLKKYAYSVPSCESITVFFKNQEDLEVCKAFVQQEPSLQVVQTDPCNIEICSGEAGKGNGLRLLAELLSVPVEETIGVGDGENDLTMIEAAGLGLAMANAAPEVKALADGVICSNEEHGIEYILKHYIATIS